MKSTPTDLTAENTHLNKTEYVTTALSPNAIRSMLSQAQKKKTKNQSNQSKFPEEYAEWTTKTQHRFLVPSNTKY